MSQSTLEFILFIIVILFVFFGPTQEKPSHLVNISKLILSVAIACWFVSKAYLNMLGV